MKSLPEIITANKEKEMIRMEDELATPFEIRATFHNHLIGDDGEGIDLHVLTLVHGCEKKAGEIVLALDWVRCPYCSKRVPERIRRIFKQ